MGWQQSSWQVGHYFTIDCTRWGLHQRSGVLPEVRAGSSSNVSAKLRTCGPQDRKATHQLWLSSSMSLWRKSTGFRGRTQQQQDQEWNGMAWACGRVVGIESKVGPLPSSGLCPQFILALFNTVIWPFAIEEHIPFNVFRMWQLFFQINSFVSSLVVSSLHIWSKYSEYSPEWFSPCLIKFKWNLAITKASKCQISHSESLWKEGYRK